MTGSQIRLIYFNRQGEIRRISIREGTTVLGRRPDCDVRIPKPYVSRKHCRIVIEGEQATVQDLGSANGTYVNNEKIMESPVRAGDKLRVGPITFTFEVNGAPAEIEDLGRERELEGSGLPIGDDLDDELPPGLEL